MRHVRPSLLMTFNTSVYSPHGETLQDQFNVCSHMSSHYRRLYSSKNVVDTSPPRSFGLNRASSRAINNVSAHFMDAVISDSRNPPSTYRYFHDERKSGMKHKPPKLSSQLLVPCTLKTKQSYDLMERHADRFVVPRKAFQPRILKSEAESKVRFLHTYHPPRSKDKRLMAAKNNVEEDEYSHDDFAQDDSSQCNCSQDDWKPMETEDLQQVDQVKMRSSSAQSDAKTSSCDSAYSGGVSSGRESRGLPVDQRQDDIRYMKFIHEITEDVLRRGVFTNKGLQLLFQRHIGNNEFLLNKERMKIEVQKLSEELGICEEEVSSLGSVLLQEGESRQPDVSAEDKLSCSTNCPNPRMDMSLAADDEMCFRENGCICTCEATVLPSEMAARVGSGNVGSEMVADSGCCSSKYDPKMQRFWMSMSNRISLQCTSRATNF